VGACNNPALCLGKGARLAASFHSGNFGGERASILDRQSTIGATFRDTLKDPKKAVVLTQAGFVPKNEAQTWLASDIGGVWKSLQMGGLSDGCRSVT
jgi:hypothetical protein